MNWIFCPFDADEQSPLLGKRNIYDSDNALKYDLQFLVVFLTAKSNIRTINTNTMSPLRENYMIFHGWGGTIRSFERCV